jgi:hypothetical protein
MPKIRGRLATPLDMTHVRPNAIPRVRGVGPVRSRERRLAAPNAGAPRRGVSSFIPLGTDPPSSQRPPWKRGGDGRAAALPPMQEREGRRSRGQQTPGPRPRGERARRRRRRFLRVATATGALPASCPSRKCTSALSSPTRSAWRPNTRPASKRSSGMASRSSSSRGDLRVRERLICEFGQRRSRPRAKRGAERRYRWVRRHALERRQSLIAADCEHSRMVGALVHLDVGAVLALHDRRRRRPGHDATARMARRPVAASSAMSVVAIGGRRSSLAGGCQRSPNGAAPRRDSEEAYDRIASGPGPDLPA